MADPFAPPSDAPRARRAPAKAPAEDPEYAPREANPRSEPAHAGTFWLVAGIGIGLLALARVIQFFTYVGDLDGEDMAPAIFGLFGALALTVGLALAALLQRGLSAGVRTALMIAAGYFALSSSVFGLLAGLGGMFGRF